MWRPLARAPASTDTRSAVKDTEALPLDYSSPDLVYCKRPNTDQHEVLYWNGKHSHGWHLGVAAQARLEAILAVRTGHRAGAPGTSSL